MNLIRTQPANAAQVWIQPNEFDGDRLWQFQTNEKALRLHRPGLRSVVASDRRVAQPTEPARHPLLLPRLAAGF